MSQEILAQLVAMSRSLGEPARDYVILGEGNTSARANDETFWVKASGTQLHGIDEAGFVRVRFAPILALLDAGEVSDEQVKDELAGAVVGFVGKRPSVETAVHAAALTVGQARFVGHTHPTAVNAILCSQQAEAALAGRLFPDEIVVCGPVPIYLPYIDPGVPLARAVGQAIQRHQENYGESPKVILLQNHGLFVLGQSAQEVENVTAMMVKTARILVGTYALGGPRFLTPEAAARIRTRPDEAYRQRQLD
ncbi:MAG: class II aldolase [Ardenticatenaceae bacterium]|nr:class II aldolase [Anaerolineales bacterium]MCB8922166.1 class II aldolase [Ardenticatenaceae bacterium]MCB8991147.1 class II aldolase [Ardenticatenaceae bacterium]MCB9005301.1 class II aldolase [Ardenticatenaceae bacterium]